MPSLLVLFGCHEPILLPELQIMVKNENASAELVL